MKDRNEVNSRYLFGRSDGWALDDSVQLQHSEAGKKLRLTARRLDVRERYRRCYSFPSFNGPWWLNQYSPTLEPKLVGVLYNREHLIIHFLSSGILHISSMLHQPAVSGRSSPPVRQRRTALHGLH